MVFLVCVHIYNVDKLFGTSSPFKVICQCLKIKELKKTTVQRLIKIKLHRKTHFCKHIFNISIMQGQLY